MDEWYIFDNRVTTGPFSSSALLQFSRAGRLGSTALVRCGKQGKWVALADAGLVQTAATPASACPEAAALRIENGQMRFHCPMCGQHYRGDMLYFGKKLECQACGSKFQLPQAATPVPQQSWELESIGELLEGDLTCPHCWKSFSADQLLSIATHPSLLGDPVAGEFESLRFVPRQFNSIGLPLDAKGSACTEMACPRCHLRIPAALIELKSYYISIVGAPSSSKSYYLTALVHTLRSLMSEYFLLSFLDVDPVQNAVIDSYERAIFMALEAGKVATLPKTQQIGSEFSNRVRLNEMLIDLPKPFIFELTPAGEECRERAASLIFYDNAGEQFQPGAESVVNPATLHLACSNGIIFLFDPINDPAMRTICNPDDPQLTINRHVSDQTVLLTEMAKRIRRHRNLGAGEKCTIPLMVAVAKYDAWRESFPIDVEKLHPVADGGDSAQATLAVDVLASVSFALREFLLTVAPAFVHAAESLFAEVSFLPVSNFGTLAKSGDSGQIGIVPAELHPIWVEEPFLWLLNKFGLIGRAAPPPAQKSDSSLKARIDGGVLLFEHPETGRKVRLPLNYAGTTLEIGTRSYKLPEVPPSSEPQKKAKR